MSPDRFAGPIRGELLGTEGLAEYARALARQQRVLPPTVKGWAQKQRGQGPLLQRLDETRKILDSARVTINDATDRGVDISPAGEWLLDNFYVIQEHVREVRASMPKGYYQELPKLATGVLAGYPRIYEVAIELIAHTEGYLKAENIELFDREFQRGATLGTGELWAMPTMLRLGLIENIRRMTLRVVQRLAELDAADKWAKRLREASEGGAQTLAGVLAEFVNDHPPLTPAFVSRFLQQIRSYQSNFTPLRWLEQWIAEDGLNAEDAVTKANQRLALTQVVMANSITSLRTIARLDWSEWVESMNATEAILRQDPAHAYAAMTFNSRDLYRHVIEDIAKRTSSTEVDIAERALDLARRAIDIPGVDPRLTHIGYYLVDDGVRDLERAVAYTPPWQEALHQWVIAHPDLVYFGGITLCSAILVAVPFLAIGRVSVGAFFAVLALAIIPANDIAINIVHQLVTMFLPPRLIPKLDFEEGVPTAYRTAVVVPTLLGSVDAVKEALDHLEVQYLANRDPNLYFALLSDFTDSPTEVRAGDDEILAAAVAGIRTLNEKYASDTFFLFHRSRQWNAGEGVWMAWERKRGKLAQFNQFLRGGASGAFSTIVGDTAPLAHVVYVITLDSDTVLPRGAAALLIGAMAHPVNRAVFDPASGRVIRGYGILQPRVGISLESANRSLFAAISSGRPGVDPYTTAVSDVYQDLFAEGSFTGKGIYDVDAFEQATEDKFPENALLSHDLIEGTYARAALVTDIEFYDDYPTRYLTYTRRKHRWIRGDWQLLPWLFARVRGTHGMQRNRLSAISRWKIFDNLRRSVVEIAQLALLVAGWTVLPGGPFLWTGLVLAGMATPFVFGIALSVVSPPQGDSWRAYYKAVGRDMVASLQQYLLLLTFLPHQAFVSADAIIRTLWRMFVNHRKMLEWQTASQVERIMAAGQPREVWRKMSPAVIVTAAILLIVLTAGIGRAHMIRLPNGLYHMGSPIRWWYLAVTMPLVLLWAVSPSIAEALSAPAVRRERRLTGSESWTALRYALLHWHFFDRFVTADTQWLAPDNFQEDPSPVVAMRTSPTNIGLQLLGIVSAFDLGFLSSGAMIERLELVFRTLERMARYRGHFYNWYDLTDLEILEPAYVSTVDSGNLAGDLIALKQACLAIIDAPVVDTRVWDALQTALELAVENLRSMASSGDVASPKQWQAVLEAGERVRAVLQSLPTLTGAQNAEALSSKTLQTIADRLKAAERVVVERTEDLTNVDIVPGRDWIVWSRQHLERWASDVAAIGDGAKSLREAAATSTHAAEQVKRLEAIAARAHEYAIEMDFKFLYDSRRKLFSIGFQVGTATLDPSLYDLLASEARLASYVAIAKGDVQAEHWFKLGRGLTTAAGDTALISWSGSMFEYLMPALIMESFPFTLLDQTYTGAVRRQIAYGAERGVPWGVSESAYNARDRHQTYQYRGFGVPDLALKRGLSKDLVVAPYATLLALMIEPHPAMRNLATLEKEGALGLFGFRDAVDYTRPTVGSSHALVGTYMAHHVGMSLVSLNNAIHSDIWPSRFHSDPLIKSAELVLFERIPRRFVLTEAQTDEGDEIAARRRGSEKPAARTLDTPNTPEPRVTLLGHAPYTLMISNAGSGYARFESYQVTRWRNDSTLDRFGQWCYLHDTTTGRVWPAAYQPMGDDAQPEWYRSTFASDRATFSRRDGDIDTRLEVTVVPDDAAEVRRVTITNNGATARDIELTTYGEISLAPPEADRTHPAFQNLFVETEFVAPHGAILATRRPRSADERALWCAHVVATGPEIVGRPTCETDRARFVGRNRTVRNPAAMATGGALSGTTGAVLDPIYAIRVCVRIGAGQSARVAFTTLVAPTRDRALELADRYHDPYSAQRALDLSWMHAQVELRELSITPADAALYQELAGYLFFSDRAVRAPAKDMLSIRRGIDALWAHGISGDWPILLATVDQPAGVATVKELLQAHQYWRGKGMTVDLVILNTNPPSYQQDLQDELTATVLASTEAALVDKPGGVMLRRRDLLPPDDLVVLRATARVHVPCDGLRLAEILELPETEPEYPPAFEPTTQSGGGIVSAGVLAQAAARSGDGARGEVLLHSAPEIDFDNGLGGLAADGSYQIRLVDGATTPAPWTNVIANENGGFLISENGGGYVWAENSFFFRLTPWLNDPVADEPTDILYIRDDETGEVWAATPDPVRHQTPYLVRHEPGRTEFQHSHAGLTTVLTLGMPEHDVVKIAKLTITNDTATPRPVTITHYADLCLGVMREHTQHQMRTQFDREVEAILAQNGYDQDFAGKVAFTALSLPVTSYTGDRREFLGRNGTLAAPAALERSLLAEACGPLYDPCAALQCTMTISPGETRVVVALLGSGTGEAECRALIKKYRDPAAATSAIDGHAGAWRRRLDTIQVKTPDPACDAVLNGWLLYQALACRFFARTALYQSSGAYGFRDQLQDSMAFVYCEPKLAREHIVRSAGRQFVEGDVQHWWHAHNGRGVRTRFSDDLAWLPFVVDHYLAVTGDTSVLDEAVPFITMRALEPNEQELYDRPDVSQESATVYEHCVRALRKAATVGQHGLPLMGIGDWNDGMNRVGVGGKGVSVWLAWFLITTMRRFAAHCDARSDGTTGNDLRSKADAYAAAIERESWDGQWYTRAYFDDGTPLGSHTNDECQIDLIAQSWSVISGAGETDHARTACESAYARLVREDARLIMLLTPPFDRTDHDPGYIKGYLPGVRENGAQYTHAATWYVLARAMLGDGDVAYRLYEMLNPFTHPVDTYKVEPYVIAADVYTAEGHLGRGGWTWYTGSAAWAYRVGLEGILGFKKRGTTLRLDPVIPSAWDGFELTYRYGSATYHIVVQNPDHVSRGDEPTEIPLVDDGQVHEITVTIGARDPSPLVR